MPVAKNLVCDGVWNKNRQEVMFQLNEKLIAVNKYHLVISFPNKIKGFIQKGSFNVSDDSLKIECIE